MNPIPSHESYMRRMAAVTAVGAHQPTGTKRNLGFVVHVARRCCYRRCRIETLGHFSADAVGEILSSALAEILPRRLRSSIGRRMHAR